MFTSTLLDWFALNGRDLPWRHTRDPYAIWLSEIILQQTRIQQGMDYWLRFMQRWPRVEDLAAATEDEVLREWQGLGYYSRARNLHTAAQQVHARGGFPTTMEGLRSLKGVGDYTAAAIGSIAFGLPAAVVDGNVYRVLARHYGIDTPINTTQGKKVFTELAQSLLPTDQPAAFNQAMMDFGAIQCTPQSPRCVICPLQETCEALRTGRISELPVKERKLKVQTVRLTYLYIRCNGKVAMRKRPAGGIWQGLWEPLLTEDTDLLSQARLLCKDVKHVLTHRILLADFYLWETDTRPTLPEEYVWMDESDMDQYAVPRLIEILFSKIPSST
ncbi:MAG: A/G-specific adenine glycosylase [Bacteroidaceae bacterium]|nr:A/G-specific adenine glycosylase [Bacteroidaceae bacterium]